MHWQDRINPTPCLMDDLLQVESKEDHSERKSSGFFGDAGVSLFIQPGLALGCTTRKTNDMAHDLVTERNVHRRLGSGTAEYFRQPAQDA